jgi:hypothetical protein
MQSGVGMAAFNIRDRDGTGSLSVMFDGNDEYWVAVLSGQGVTARRRVYAYAPHGRFDRIFAEMAAAWRGWVGAKTWRSLESELELVCTRDAIGHVQIAVQLRMDMKAEWRVRGVLTVEAGQLDGLAAAATEFLSADGPDT